MRPSLVTSIAQEVIHELEENGRWLGPEGRAKDEGPVYVGLRENGIMRASAWEEGIGWQDGIAGAIRRASDKLGLGQADRIDTVEVCLSHSYRRVDSAGDRRHITTIHRGVRGLEVKFGNLRRRWAPTEMIARNLSFDKAVERFASDNRISKSALASGDLRKQVFEAHQFLVGLDNGKVVSVTPMFRGNTLVPVADVTRHNVRRLADGLADWLIRNVNDNGRITYKYWPSLGRESSSNNMIRQFMASVCLGRLWTATKDPRLPVLIDRNLQYNLSEYFHREGKFGVIEFRGKAKLGAQALAALAIIESPCREKYASQERSLVALVDHLWNDDGSFRTFFKPADRNDNQNFYPGEALILWATMHRQTDDPDLRRKMFKSFEYYSRWHLDERHRNPAFVPWHTQAYYMLWQKTRSEELRDFIFEMNDWLLVTQQWDDARYEDAKGRFYNPKRRDYGPPHASSTGVYLEGLIDAFRLAREVDSEQRVYAYRRAIVRGLRSIMQLQFTDHTDMFYISKRDRVDGGVRTTVYNNEIRVDNIQHTLMGILKILRHFEEDDFLAAQWSSPE